MFSIETRSKYEPLYFSLFLRLYKGVLIFKKKTTFFIWVVSKKLFIFLVILKSFLIKYNFFFCPNRNSCCVLFFREDDFRFPFFAVNAIDHLCLWAKTNYSQIWTKYFHLNSSFQRRCCRFRWKYFGVLRNWGFLRALNWSSINRASNPVGCSDCCYFAL